MTASVAFICGGRGAGRLVSISCDAPAGCRAQVSYSDKEAYLAAGHAGWRRVGNGEGATFFCPAHAAAAAPS